jgi:hypothetical protein
MAVGLPGLPLQTPASDGAKLPGAGIKVEGRPSPARPRASSKSLRGNSKGEKAGEIESKEIPVLLEHKPAAARLTSIPQ